MTAVMTHTFDSQDCCTHGMHQDCEYPDGVILALGQPTHYVGRHPPAFTFGILKFTESAVALQLQVWKELSGHFSIANRPFWN